MDATTLHLTATLQIQLESEHHIVMQKQVLSLPRHAGLGLGCQETLPVSAASRLPNFVPALGSGGRAAVS